MCPLSQCNLCDLTLGVYAGNNFLCGENGVREFLDDHRCLRVDLADLARQAPGPLMPLGTPVGGLPARHRCNQSTRGSVTDRKHPTFDAWACRIRIPLPTDPKQCRLDHTINTMASRRDFLSQPAPENYVAGIGRGAVGFTTRSDLGPARDGPSEEQISSAIKKRSEQLGLTEAKEGGGDDEGGGGGDDSRYQDPDNEVGLFAGGIYEKDDEEADRIWQEVDEKMAKRRQKQRFVLFVSESSPHLLPFSPFPLHPFLVKQKVYRL